MNAWAVIAAAGSGERMGSVQNKTLLPLCGTPVICRSVRALKNDCRGIIVCARPQDEAQIKQALAADGLQVDAYAPGGATRTQSVAAALALLPQDCDAVLVHDGARPLVSNSLIERILHSVEAYGSGVPALPLTDTVKQVDSQGNAVNTLERNKLRTVQTPQGFRKELLLRAYAQAQEGASDDAALVEALGIPVHLVEGDSGNIKLTYPEDVARAQQVLSGGGQLRCGYGYDAHRLADGRALWLCGVQLPFAKGLLGHSDADAGLHALIDALLGAAALGDIGRHFPESDAAYMNISSLELLRRTRDILARHGFYARNVDVTLVLQQPRVAPYVEAMRVAIAQALALPLDAVSVKGKSTEGMGFEGTGEGISAHACATVTEIAKP